MQLENHENFVYNHFGGFSAAMCTNTDTYIPTVCGDTYLLLCAEEVFKL